MKKVLIITYFWPPAGGPGVQRILKFVKYLPKFGWEPIILTVQNGEYPAIDYSLEKNIPNTCKVYKTNSFEPFSLYKKFLGIKNNQHIPTAVLTEEKVSFKKRIANWIRLNLFIPDAKIGWKYFAVKEGLNIIAREKPDIIFSSSPPPTVHLIAKKIAKKSNLKWIADFRDPWTEIHYYEDQPRLSLIKKIDKSLESKVLHTADKITCISKLDMEDDFGKKTNPLKCVNIPNGFDEDDFGKFNINKTNKSVFTMLHLGAVNNERNPKALFEAIKRLKNNGLINSTMFTLKFVGRIESIIKETVTSFDIDDLITFVDYLPHQKALKYMEECSILILLITNSKKNNRILPGKTFEYLRAQKFILTFGPSDGETARILMNAKAGEVVEYSDTQKIINIITKQVELWKSGTSTYFSNKQEIERYSRENLTGDLASVFNDLTD